MGGDRKLEIIPSDIVNLKKKKLFWPFSNTYFGETYSEKDYFFTFAKIIPPLALCMMSRVFVSAFGRFDRFVVVVSVVAPTSYPIGNLLVCDIAIAIIYL